MKSRKEYITEPGDRRWLYASPWVAAAGGLMVVLLLVAMALLPPGSPAADNARASAPPAAAAAPASTAGPAYTLPAIAPDAESYAAPGTMPPTF